jgi:hypothetical protein
MLHALKKIMNEKAMYERYIRGVEEGQQIEIQIPLE